MEMRIPTQCNQRGGTLTPELNGLLAFFFARHRMTLIPSNDHDAVDDGEGKGGVPGAVYKIFPSEIHFATN